MLPIFPKNYRRFQFYASQGRRYPPGNLGIDLRGVVRLDALPEQVREVLRVDPGGTETLLQVGEPFGTERLFAVVAARLARAITSAIHRCASVLASVRVVHGLVPLAVRLERDDSFNFD